jgi:hypothetical protein
VTVSNTTLTQETPYLTFSTKFFKPKGSGSNHLFKAKASKELPTALLWFSKVLKAEERVLVCSFVDKQAVDFIRKMQQRCRENKQIT